MKTSALALGLALALPLTLAVGAAAVQEAPVPAEPAAQHEWLQQLVGAWHVTQAEMATPDGGWLAMEAEWREDVRALGGLWVVSSAEGEMAGMALSASMTIGYDPRQEAFVGTWVDSTQPHLWVYRGALDEARRVLTLEAEGPSFTDPDALALYRDVIELEGPDKKVQTSAVRGADGTWTTFMRSTLERVR